MIPQKIKIVSDDNELEFMGIIKPIGTAVKFNNYRYTKSETKCGQLLGLTDLELEKALKNQTMIAI